MTETQELLTPNITDYIIIGVICVSTFISLMRGFVKESISLCIWGIGFLVSIKFYQTFAAVLEPYIVSIAIRQIASFAGIFVLVLIIGALFNHLLSFLVSKTGLSGTDRVLGMFFGCARGILLIAVLLLVISSTAFVHDHWWKESVLIPHFQVLVDWLRVFLPEKMTSIAGVIQQ